MNEAKKIRWTGKFPESSREVPGNSESSPSESPPTWESVPLEKTPAGSALIFSVSDRKLIKWLAGLYFAQDPDAGLLLAPDGRWWPVCATVRRFVKFFENPSRQEVCGHPERPGAV